MKKLRRRLQGVEALADARCPVIKDLVGPDLVEYVVGLGCEPHVDPSEFGKLRERQWYAGSYLFLFVAFMTYSSYGKSRPKRKDKGGRKNGPPRLHVGSLMGRLVQQRKTIAMRAAAV